MSGELARPIPVQNVETTCLRCHDGRQARTEPHPVGRRFGPMTRPADWPAPDDKVTCATCHQVHPTGDPRASRPLQNPMFLRGGGTDMLAFCGRCHPGADEPQRRYNPHAAQIDNGQVAQQSCAFCHNKPMPHGASAARTGQPALRADPISLCIGCHPTHLEWSEKGHIGTKVTPRILGSLTAFARARNLTPPSTQPAAGFLPLAGGDTVVCSTCHNPHYEGVFPPGSPLANGAAQPAPAAEQLRGLHSQLCGACHGK
jgi:predicted CXXCH cytochrome family protein